MDRHLERIPPGKGGRHARYATRTKRQRTPATHARKRPQAALYQQSSKGRKVRCPEGHKMKRALNQIAILVCWLGFALLLYMALVVIG